MKAESEEGGKARPMKRQSISDGMVKFSSSPILCCPEDVRCKHNCPDKRRFCLDCRMPVCKSCRLLLQDKQTVPMALANDNWYGYLQRWIFDVQVTWMEKTVASPHWTGMTLFTMRQQGDKGRRRRHLLHDRAYQAVSRVAFKGQVFSAPMDWNNLIDQLE